eukprot:1905479-Amphidinium_carterae.1
MAIWPTVRSELRAVLGLLPFFKASWRAGWGQTTYMSDASPWGWGVCSAQAPEDMIGDSGRILERGRYLKKYSGRAGRVSTGFDHLSKMTFSEHDTVLTPSPDGLDYGSYQECDVRPDFPEIPQRLLDLEWHERIRGGCNATAWQQPIHVKEARAINQAMRLAIQDTTQPRVLLMTDNMSVVLAAGRKRSAAFALLRQLRILTFMELVSGVRATIRWLPSESNVADRPSRLPPTALLHVEQATTWGDQVGKATVDAADGRGPNHKLGECAVGPAAGHGRHGQRQFERESAQ